MKKQLIKIFQNYRQKYYTRKTEKTVLSFKKPLKVNNKSHFTRNVLLGRNTHFNGINISGQGEVTIGDNFHSGKECMIITDVHNFEGASLPYDDTYIIKNVIIEDNVWIGSRVIILGGVTIGEGAIIQAGSVVVSDIPSCAIAGGSPARVFKYRNKTHYNKLKSEKKFH